MQIQEVKMPKIVLRVLSESMFQRVEKQQNQSHEMLNTAQVMSDSTFAWTANSFSSMWEKLV
ncbi:hypothetical protein V6Z12_A04G189300 [Gossypium hirsutum]